MFKERFWYPPISDIWNITWLLTSKSSIYSHQSFFWTPDLAASGTSFLMCLRSLIRFFNILTSLWRFGCCTWQKNIFAQEHWGCRNIHSGVFAAAIITSTLPTPGDLLHWRSRFILAHHSRLLYRLYSLFSLMTLHCTSVCRRDGWRGERYSELSFTTGKEVCSKNLRVCKRYVYMLQPLDGTSFYEKNEISWNSPKSFNQQVPQSNTECPKKLPFWNFSKLNPMLF